MQIVFDHKDAVEDLAQNQQGENAIESFSGPVDDEIVGRMTAGYLSSTVSDNGKSHIGEEDRKFPVLLAPDEKDNKHQQQHWRGEAQQ